MGVYSVLVCHECRELLNLEKSYFPLGVKESIMDTLTDLFAGLGGYERGLGYAETDLFHRCRSLIFFRKHLGHKIERVFDFQNSYYDKKIRKYKEIKGRVPNPELGKDQSILEYLDFGVHEEFFNNFEKEIKLRFNVKKIAEALVKFKKEGVIGDWWSLGFVDGLIDQACFTWSDKSYSNPKAKITTTCLTLKEFTSSEKKLEQVIRDKIKQGAAS